MSSLSARGPDWAYSLTHYRHTVICLSIFYCLHFMRNRNTRVVELFLNVGITKQFTTFIHSLHLLIDSKTLHVSE